MTESASMKLFPDERILLEANSGLLKLTTHRVRFEHQRSGDSVVIGITLDAVASCGLVTTTYPILLLLALLAAIGGLASSSHDSGAMLWLFLAACLLVLAYFLSRKVVLRISSAGDDIIVGVQRVGRAPLLEFIDALEQAKVQRLENSAAARRQAT
ncbi:MAG: hypothetical protein SFV15_17655 [Polyangiaceae bacterium]|nr:hypothetical protein [Polyangiaceae bacterium]